MEIKIANELTLAALIQKLAGIANTFGADANVYAMLLTDISIIAQDATTATDLRFRYYWGISNNGTEIKANCTSLEKWAKAQPVVQMYRITHESHNCYTLELITD